MNNEIENPENNNIGNENSERRNRKNIISEAFKLIYSKKMYYMELILEFL